jgi:hypothetical protein
VDEEETRTQIATDRVIVMCDGVESGFLALESKDKEIRPCAMHWKGGAIDANMLIFGFFLFVDFKRLPHLHIYFMTVLCDHWL